MKLLQTLLLTSLCALTLPASAQWQWLDKDGRKVFSDRPPPVDVPDKNILGKPRSVGKATVSPVAADEAPAQAAANGTNTPASPLDKEVQARKKQAAEAEAAKRKAEEERVARAQAENCARARTAKTAFDSGLRQTRTNDKGEREFLDDAAREAEARRLQDIIASDCK